MTTSTISSALRALVAQQAGHRCGYCLTRQEYVPSEGIDPFAGQSVPLFHPRNQAWNEHFGWSESGELIVGLSSIGRATVIALQMNNIVAVTVRRNWIAAGWHPPQI